ncbi:MAG: N-acetylmuramoyl-L-alanine amidase family protein [Ruminococcaceae bacterium]|nr:N-acetylmuramoyl-L-alanine amidase family protein [Oscillospiraceae bacterium]
MKRTNRLKLVSLVLTLAMVISFLPLSVIPVAAEESPVASITVENISPLIENYHGFMARDVIGHDEEGYPIWSDEFFYYDPNYSKPVITIEYEDGTGFETEILDGGFYASYYSENLDEYAVFGVKSPQDIEHQWSVGNTYTAYVLIGGVSTEFDVEIVENPIESITVENISPLIENHSRYGMMTQDWLYYDEETGTHVYSEEYFRYFPNCSYPTVTITYKEESGFETETFDGKDNSSYYSEQLKAHVDFVEFEGVQNHENPWIAGNTYQVSASICGVSTTFDVEIIENPVKSITVTDITVYENDRYHGYMNSNYLGFDENTGESIYSSEYFYYDPDWFELEIVVEYEEDSGFETETLEASWEGFGYLYRSKQLDDFVEFENVSEQDYDHQWTKDNTYQVSASICGVSTTFDVAIVESPVESITVTNIEIYENDKDYGSMVADYLYYDEEAETEIFSDEYFYYVPYWFELEIVVEYKEETGFDPEILKEKWTGDMRDYYSETLDRPVYFEETQNFYNQWSVGTHTVYAEIAGVSTTFDVTITESPVASITVTNVVIFERDKENYGRMIRDWLGFDEDGEPIFSDEYFCYDFIPCEPTVVITYKEGTGFETETLTGSPYISEELGKPVYFDDEQNYFNQWTAGSKNPVRAEVLGKYTTFYVFIIEDTGWQKFDEKWYYFDEDGKMAINKWVRDTKDWCYLGEDGAMVTDKWVADKGYWYYLGSDGRMVRNKWVRDSVTWCYLGENGAMVTNQWKQDKEGYWYYLGANGRILINKWFYYDGYWYYFGENGAMATNKWVADSKGWCYLDAKGKMVTNKWVRDTVTWCYIGADGRAVKNQWQKDSNGWCYLDENARLTIGWKQISGKWYYFNRNGTMVTGRQVIDGKVYRFNSNGVWIG